VSLFDVRHQERAQRLLLRALGCARLPHAYIFHGPAGVGKEMLARRLASLLLCSDSQAGSGAADVPGGLADLAQAGRTPCGACRACKLMAADNHPDLHVVHRLLNAYHPDALVRNRKAVNLGVEVIRHFLIEPAGIAANMGSYKVFIIRDADRISPSAQNALLKTLEEPPPATILILLVSALDQLLPTTRSRCQLVPFGPLPDAFVLERLQAVQPDLAADDARVYATLAQGSIAAALRYAEDELADFNRALAAMLASLTPHSATEAVKAIMEFTKQHSGAYRKRDPELSETAAQREALRAVFALLATAYRERMARACGPDDSDADPMALAHAVRVIARAEGQLELNVNVQLCVESLVFALARLPHMPRAAFT
jgi:DNA polymerase-3 subunit delta'